MPARDSVTKVVFVVAFQLCQGKGVEYDLHSGGPGENGNTGCQPPLHDCPGEEDRTVGSVDGKQRGQTWKSNKYETLNKPPAVYQSHHETELFLYGRSSSVLLGKLLQCCKSLNKDSGLFLFCCSSALLTPGAHGRGDLLICRLPRGYFPPRRAVN